MWVYIGIMWHNVHLCLPLRGLKAGRYKKNTLTVVLKRPYTLLFIRLPRWSSGLIPRSYKVLLGFFAVFRKFLSSSTESGIVPST
ncbi:hypothetical protein SFRURICE_009576 [Spodoptera frugiperda]|nr:hypothetical protein SFRURICE_009576 [Spodoptera frugiperda]